MSVDAKGYFEAKFVQHLMDTGKFTIEVNGMRFDFEPEQNKPAIFAVSRNSEQNRFTVNLDGYQIFQ